MIEIEERWRQKVEALESEVALDLQVIGEANLGLVKLRAENKALQARLDAVKPYLEHKVVCVSWRGRDCNCGLAAALKQEPSDVS